MKLKKSLKNIYQILCVYTHISNSYRNHRHALFPPRMGGSAAGQLLDGLTRYDLGQKVSEHVRCQNRSNQVNRSNNLPTVLVMKSHELGILVIYVQKLQLWQSKKGRKGQLSTGMDGQQITILYVRVGQLLALLFIRNGQLLTIMYVRNSQPLT